MNPAELGALVDAARSAQRMAYAPYSGFRVGAALLCSDGEGNRSVVTGCNVENAAYPSSLCAERAAVAGALVRGLRIFHAVAIVTDAAAPSSPCGMCRQVLAEFAPELPVISVAADGQVARWSMKELLPHAFAPASLTRG